MPDALPFSIRRATVNDTETLALIGTATFLDAFIHDIPGPAILAHCQTQHSAEAYGRYLSNDDPRTACWLIEHASTGAPMGYALTCPPDLPGDVGANDLELKRIYCLSRAHGSGTAAALMEAAITHAQSVAAPRLWLGTYEGNARAIAFYRKYGFETVGERRFQVGDEIFDDIIMARRV